MPIDNFKVKTNKTIKPQNHNFYANSVQFNWTYLARVAVNVSQLLSLICDQQSAA